MSLTTADPALSNRGATFSRAKNTHVTETEDLIPCMVRCRAGIESASSHLQTLRTSARLYLHDCMVIKWNT